MPFSGPGDDKLPSNVKAMPEPKRRQWVNIFNKTFANCRKASVGGGQGSVAKCEATAFKFANGAVKEMTMDELTEEEELTASGGSSVAEMMHKGHEGEREKCEKCGPSMIEIAPPPLGGATSFADVDQYEEAEKLESHVFSQEWRFRKIVDNIFGSDELSLAEKLAKVKAAATDLEDRVAKPPEEKGLVDRVKGALGIADKATKREDGKDFPASAYAYVPDATKPSTWKLRLTKTPGAGPDAGIVGAAIAALGKGFRGQKVQIPAADLPAVKTKVRAAWRKANPDKKPADMPATIKEAAPGAFSAFKDAQGNWRWMTLTSNMWRDRDGEIIPGAAHEDYVAYADRTKDMPELRLWHVPGSRVGRADWVDYAHGFVLHSGVFDKGMEDVAKSLVTANEPLGVSHGFYHNKDAESDTYPSYRDFEVSVLPLERAANQWTEFTADNTKEVVMGLSDERRGFLVEHIGEGRVTALEKLLEEKEEDLKSGAVDFKEVLAEAIKATPEGAAKPAEGEGDAPKDDPIAKLAELVEAQGTQLTEIVTAQGDQGKAIKELQRTDDEKIAAAMSPDRKPPANGERPSEGKGNEISAEKAKDKGADPAEELEIPDTPGGRALKQLSGAGGGSGG
jgi:hypothetical protein